MKKPMIIALLITGALLLAAGSALFRGDSTTATRQTALTVDDIMVLEPEFRGTYGELKRHPDLLVAIEARWAKQNKTASESAAFGYRAISSIPPGSDNVIIGK